MRRAIRQLRGLLAYFSIPALGAVAPLLVIPAIASQFGGSAWASVAIAQSVGGAASIVAELGWGVVGPQRVAQVSSNRRFLIYRSALSSKAVASLILAPIAGVVTFMIAPQYAVECAVLAVGATIGALSPGWFFIGSGKPYMVLLTDSLPRLLANVISAAGILLGLPLALYAGAMLVQPLVTLAAAGIILGPSFVPGWRDFRRSGKTIRAQSVIAAGRAVSVLYTALPIAIVGFVAPSVVPVFAASERLMRMSLTILSGVPNRLQSWIGGGQSLDERRARARKSITYNALLGLVCGLGFAVLAPFVSHVLFAGTIEVPFAVSIASGALLWCICLSRGVGLALVASQQANSITTAIFFAAITGVAVLVPLTLTLGAAGAVLGELAAEIVGVGIQAAILGRYLRRKRT
jgi:O-antigen/teichoic acid export membrane protein